jgi:hypothetical protein
MRWAESGQWRTHVTVEGPRVLVIIVLSSAVVLEAFHRTHTVLEWRLHDTAEGCLIETFSVNTLREAQCFNIPRDPRAQNLYHFWFSFARLYDFSGRVLEQPDSGWNKHFWQPSPLLAVLILLLTSFKYNSGNFRKDRLRTYRNLS